MPRISRLVLLVALALATLPLPAVAAAPGDAAQGRLHVLMLNGGGTREENFQSHLRHLRELAAHWQAAGLPRERITILASDGADPGPDLATSRVEPEDFWRLEGTQLEDLLGEPLRFETSTVPGFTLQPATRAELGRTLRTLRARLAPGDTLLLYVTDHGVEDRKDPLRNRISLWGRQEGINVRQLASELAQLPPSVQVVMVMSQCFSGGFAHLPELLPPGRAPVCGYFASPPDRPAYGCFPESNNADRSGHGFSFIDAIARHRRLPDAHADLLARDDTPDVPLRTSDRLLRDELGRAADAAGVADEALADRLLAKAPADKDPDRALAAELSRAFGGPSPPTIAGLEQAMDELATLRERVSQHQKLWRSALGDDVRAQLDDFLAAHVDWRPRLAPPRLRQLGDEPRRALTKELLAALAGFAERAAARERRQTEQLRAHTDRADELAYRLEVREAGLLRARILLTSAAARLALAAADGARAASARDALAALDRCEAFTLPAAPAARPTRAPVKLPPVSADRAAAADLVPAWLGIAFRRPPAGLVRRYRLGPGAVQVTGVLPGSPAAAADLAPGDIVLGEKAGRFVRPNQIRAFTMLSAHGARIELETLRRGQPQLRVATLTPLPDGK